MKKTIIFSFLILFIFSILICAKILLIGETNPDEIFLLKDWKEIYDNYKPDEKVINKIDALNKEFEVEIYLGTWCKDSKSNVPKLIKILKAIRRAKVRYFAILWRKAERSEIYKLKDIKRIPTIIFYSKEKEIGRIIENPKKTLEKDTFEIIKNLRN